MRENGNNKKIQIKDDSYFNSYIYIAFLENNLNEDGSVNIPVALRPYMGFKEQILPKK